MQANYRASVGANVAHSMRLLFAPPPSAIAPIHPGECGAFHPGEHRASVRANVAHSMRLLFAPHI